MASNQTSNLKLSQWLDTDAVLRSDFNSDNKKIDAAFRSMPRMVAGSYLGTGTYGADNPRTLTFTFTPLLVVITTDSAHDLACGTVFINGQEKSNGIGSNCSSAIGMEMTLSWGEKSVSWYSSTLTTEHAAYQLNESGQVYRYFAIGLA